jgi:hypothetical protein
MRKTYIAAMASVVPLFVIQGAMAQTTAPGAPSSEKSSEYTLKGSTVKPVVNPQAKLASYELSGTSFSGTAKTTEVILTTPVDASAAPFKTESGVYLFPSVSTGFGYNDNLQSTGTNSVSSSLLNISPQVIAELKHKGDRYTALVNIKNTTYASSSADNFTNSEVAIAGDNFFTARARTGWSVGIVNGTDPRGSSDRAVQAEPDRWNTTNVNGRFIYGAPEAPGRIELSLGTQTKVYDNNRKVTATNDLTTDSLGAVVFYRLGSKTQALAEIRNSKTSYASSLAANANTETRYYGGLVWEATAATTGTVKVGSLSKKFDSAAKSSFNTGIWEIAGRWQPLTYSTVNLLATRATSDATGSGDYNLNNNLDLTWIHNWNQKLSTRLSAGKADVDYGGTPRKDSANNFGVGIDYTLTRWLRFAADISSTDNKSTEPTGAFKRTISMVTLNASL